VTPNELLGTSIEKKSATPPPILFSAQYKQKSAAAIFFFASRGDLFVLPIRFIFL